MSTGRTTRAAFAAGLALSAVLTTSSVAPALLEGASFGATDGKGGDSGSLREFAEAPPAPAGLVAEYHLIGQPRNLGAVEAYNDVPFAVRSLLGDDQLLAETRPPVAAEEVGKSSGNAPPHKVSNPSKPRLAARRPHKAASRPATGCTRCPGPIVDRSHKHANLLASLLSGDIFRITRPVRREHRPTGAAQQREAPRLTAWAFRRT